MEKKNNAIRDAVLAVKNGERPKNIVAEVDQAYFLVNAKEVAVCSQRPENALTERGIVMQLALLWVGHKLESEQIRVRVSDDGARVEIFFTAPRSGEKETQVIAWRARFIHATKRWFITRVIADKFGDKREVMASRSQAAKILPKIFAAKRLALGGEFTFPAAGRAWKYFKALESDDAEVAYQTKADARRIRREHAAKAKADGKEPAPGRTFLFKTSGGLELRRQLPNLREARKFARTHGLTLIKEEAAA